MAIPLRLACANARLACTGRLVKCEYYPMGQSILRDEPMPSITFISFSGMETTVEGDIGQSVMEVARRGGVAGIVAECGGSCACATCHVYVDDEWRKEAGEPAPGEADLLDFAYARRPNSRLSCQIRLKAALDGLIVRLPERQS